MHPKDASQREEQGASGQMQKLKGSPQRMEARKGSLGGNSLSRLGSGQESQNCDRINSGQDHRGQQEKLLYICQ